MFFIHEALHWCIGGEIPLFCFRGQVCVKILTFTALKNNGGKHDHISIPAFHFPALMCGKASFIHSCFSFLFKIHRTELLWAKNISNPPCMHTLLFTALMSSLAFFSPIHRCFYTDFRTIVKKSLLVFLALFSPTHRCFYTDSQTIVKKSIQVFLLRLTQKGFKEHTYSRHENESWNYKQAGDMDADKSCERGNVSGTAYIIKGKIHEKRTTTVLEAYMITVYTGILKFDKPSQSKINLFMEVNNRALLFIYAHV